MRGLIGIVPYVNSEPRYSKRCARVFGSSSRFTSCLYVGACRWVCAARERVSIGILPFFRDIRASERGSCFLDFREIPSCLRKQRLLRGEKRFFYEWKMCLGNSKSFQVTLLIDLGGLNYLDDVYFIVNIKKYLNCLSNMRLR